MFLLDFCLYWMKLIQWSKFVKSHVHINLMVKITAKTDITTIAKESITLLFILRVTK